MNRPKLIAFDLDGTLTQHKEPLLPRHRETLDALSRHYQLLMVGAGQTGRIYRQMGNYPIDIIGNYGMQFARFDHKLQDLQMVRDDAVTPCDRETVEQRVNTLRKTYGYTAFSGNSVEYHPSGCLTFAILGTKAAQPDKLTFDPDRKKRSIMLQAVVDAFPEYHVFIGGSSSFDLAPRPYNKYYALDQYCKEHGLKHDEILFVGDDYHPGGNDASVYESDFPFLPIDDYRTFPEKMQKLM